MSYIIKMIFYMKFLKKKKSCPTFSQNALAWHIFFPPQAIFFSQYLLMKQILLKIVIMKFRHHSSSSKNSDYEIQNALKIASKKIILIKMNIFLKPK